MAEIDPARRVPGYPDDPPRQKEVLRLKTYEYDMPFNYPNVEVQRVYNGSEKHGIELFPIKQIEIDRQSRLPADAIVIEEEEPIVEVTVIGSACTPPGWVTVECDLVEGERRPDELVPALPVRFRVDNLWGMHLRWDLLAHRDTRELKSHYRELPLTGMSCAIFRIPKSKRVRIKAGSSVPGWDEDNYPDDIHYSIRVIRVTVAEQQ